MISNSKKFIFIHVPKTGGYSIKNALIKYSDDKILTGQDSLFGKGKGWQFFDAKTSSMKMHGTLEFYQKNYPEEFKEYFIFGFVRNPWDRLLSYSIWANEGAFDKNYFKMFIRGQAKYFPAIDLTQHQFLNKDLMTIYSYEYFDDCIIDLYRRIDIPYTPMERLNSTGGNNRKYRAFYDEDDVKSVSEICHKEIEMFNYEF